MNFFRANIVRMISLLALLGGMCFSSQVEAQENQNETNVVEAPSVVLQASGIYSEIQGGDFFPWMKTGDYPSGGELGLVYRANLSDEVILMGFHLGLGVNNEKLNVDDVKLKNHLGLGIGPTCRINYGYLHAEAGLDLGVRGYLFGYIPKEMDENANGYVMGSWGLYGGTFVRVGVGPVFVGGGFELERPFEQPGELQPAVDTSNLQNASMEDVNDLNSLRPNTDNLGNVEHVSGELRANGFLTMGFWL